MNLYLVRNPDGVPVWVAFESDEERLYTYVQNTGKFLVRYRRDLDALSSETVFGALRSAR